MNEPRAAAERRVEIVSATLLAMATVLSAWCAYEAARWNGMQTVRFNAANAARTEAIRLSDQALTLSALDDQLFTEYLVARDADNPRLAALLRQRFRPELRVALTAWLTTDPFTNAHAPASPFAMSAYTSTAEAAAEGKLTFADQQVEAAKEASQRADDYILLTVLGSSVLFFSGLGAKLDGRAIQITLVVFGALLFVGTLAVAATFPII
jgi:hypothetical protein